MVFSGVLLLLYNYHIITTIPVIIPQILKIILKNILFANFCFQQVVTLFRAKKKKNLENVR